MNVIGLGTAGCNIARKFAKYPQYNICTIDATEGADVKVRERSTHEKYDEYFPKIRKKIKLSDEECLVAVCGAGKISGGVLKLLQQLADHETSVLYIQPDLALLSEVQKTQEKIVRNILQEYARSGLLKRIYLVDNILLQKGVGEVPIWGYFDTLNQALVNTLHMINVFKYSSPVLGNFIDPSELSRIATIGVMDLENDEEKWFFNLTNPRDVVYYYGINEEVLKTDGSLFKQITEFVKSKVQEKISVSYGVFQTTYEQKYCYCIKYSSMVQSFKEMLDDQEIS